MFYQIKTAIMLGIAWGVSVIVMKFATLSGISFSQIIFFGSLGVVLILSVYLRSQNRHFLFNRSFIVFGMVCAVLAYLIPEVLSLYTLRHINAGMLSVILTTVPIFAYFIALIVKEDRFSYRKFTGLILGFIAVLILILSRSQFSFVQINSWLLLAIIISICYAVYDVYASKKWPENYDPIEVAYGESIIVAVLAFPFVVVNFDYAQTIVAWRSGYWIIIALIALWSSERVLYFTAIKNGGAVYVSQAAYVSPVISIILGMLIFDEPFEIILWLCFCIILFSVMLISSSSSAIDKIMVDNK